MVCENHWCESKQSMKYLIVGPSWRYLNENLFVATASIAKKVVAVPVQRQRCITLNQNPLLKLDFLESIFKIGEEVESIIWTIECKVLHAVINQVIISQPQIIIKHRLR